MIKLYYVPMTRAGRVRFALEELGVPYELVRLDPSKKETRAPGYLKIHPLGHVPAVTDGELTIFESAAIVMYLADKHPEKGLAPPIGSPLRGLYYQWCVFTIAEMEGPLVTLFEQGKLPEGERSQAAIDRAKATWRKVVGVVEAALAGRDYLVGDSFSAADLLVGASLGWGKATGLLDESSPAALAYMRRVMGRPSAKAARAD